MDAPQITYWMGEPINEMPNEKLCELICGMVVENEQLRDKLSKASIEHIRDLANLARTRLSPTHTLMPAAQ